MAWARGYQRRMGACTHLGCALVLLAGAAHADQMDTLQDTCTPPQDSFAAHVARAEAQGWVRNDSHPTAQQFIANFNSLSNTPVALTFVRGDLVLALSNGRGITGCRIVAPLAETPSDAASFAKRFDLVANPALGPMLRMDARFFADATAPAQPTDKILGDKRPKTDRGLTGQLMSGAYFTE